MAKAQQRRFLGLMLAVGALTPSLASAEDQQLLPPYKMLRSLQFVQDSVVLGDHSAGEMQSYMLSALDERLRKADKAVFDDTRNVDAALIYSMSGGNPATLEYLMSRDARGNFDSRVADVMRKYLSGKGLLVVRSLADVAKEYRDKRVGPYISLVAANVASAKDAKAALKLYDWARLMAPGTIVEEAALRRSVSLATDAGMVPEALSYSRRYVRRFLHSPYASQFANMFVDLVVKHDKVIKPDDVVDILSFMDDARRREIYLRIARESAISGDLDLARLAAEKAQEIGGGDGDAFGSLASFYGGVANVSTDNITGALKNIDAVPDGELNARDRALRDAAKAVAEAVLQPPTAESLAQDLQPTPAAQNQTGHDAATSPLPTIGDEGKAGVRPQAAASADAAKAQEGRQDADSSFNSFVTTSRSKLDAIDGLLKQERN